MNIIELAKQAGFNHSTCEFYGEELKAFEALVRDDEREFIAEKWEKWYGYDKNGVAEFIRKRANTQGEQHEQLF